MGEEMIYYRYDPVRFRFAEYRIEVRQKDKWHMICNEIGKPMHYWTRVSLNEGEVLNNGVWFKEPNKERAKTLLKTAAEIRVKYYDVAILKRCCSYKGQEGDVWR